MKINSKKVSAFAVVLGLAVLGSSCGKSKHSGGHAAIGAEEAAADGDSANGKGESEGLNESDYSAAFSVKNFRQLAATYEEVTGVALEGSVLAEYNRQLASLPTDPDPTAISASQVSAATKLAAAFCDVLADSEALRSVRFPGINFNAPIANNDLFAEEMLDGFFGLETTLQGNRSIDIETVSELTDFILGSVNGASTSDAFMGNCTAILGSAEFYLY